VLQDKQLLKIDPFTGSVASATITDSKGIKEVFPISGSGGTYTILPK